MALLLAWSAAAAIGIPRSTEAAQNRRNGLLRKAQTIDGLKLYDLTPYSKLFTIPHLPFKHHGKLLYLGEEIRNLRNETLQAITALEEKSATTIEKAKQDYLEQLRGLRRYGKKFANIESILNAAFASIHDLDSKPISNPRSDKREKETLDRSLPNEDLDELPHLIEWIGMQRNVLMSLRDDFELNLLNATQADKHAAEETRHRFIERQRGLYEQAIALVLEMAKAAGIAIQPVVNPNTGIPRDKGQAEKAQIEKWLYHPQNMGPFRAFEKTDLRDVESLARALHETLEWVKAHPGDTKRRTLLETQIQSFKALGINKKTIEGFVEEYARQRATEQAFENVLRDFAGLAFPFYKEGFSPMNPSATH